MRTQISKIVKQLNVGVSTAVEFLRKHNIEVDANPNARIDEHAVDLLKKEFSKDKNIKAESDQITSIRGVKKNKPERRPETVKTITPEVTGLKIVGKIDLDNPGRISTPKTENKTQTPKPASKEPIPEVKAPVTSTPPENEKKPEKTVPESQPEAEAKPKDKPEAKQEVKNEVKSEPKTEKKPEQKPAESSKPADPKPVQDKKPEPKPAVAPEKKPAENQTDNDNNVFRLEPSTELPQLKVVGTIDLSALNQATRPKKKSGSERRKERNRNKENTASTEPNASRSGNGSGRRRQRIGKEKIDIEKAASMGIGQDQRKPSGNGNKGGNNNGNGGSGRNRNNQQSNGNRNQKQGNRNQNSNTREVSSEDVRKQVKETLARLQNKQTKKSVKWRKEKREEIHNRELANAEREAAESKIIKITEFVTASDLANLMEIPVNNIIATCMNLGVMVSINQRLDAETINIVAEEFGFTTEYVSAEVSEAIATEEDKEEDLVPRPPIVTVMGHVDHGKTSLLDYIRNANVIAGEAGGITQHIGAYNVKLGDGRHITFLDAPGHGAFTAMRDRGAKVTDLAIIIVAADDDVMPQTIEAINHASAAGVPMVFAINKIDKPSANPDKIKEQLAGMNYLVEDWGGKYQSQDISAKKGIGVEELMEKVLLEAEMLELKANPNRLAIGSVIESSLDKGRGYVATVLVQNGTLRTGDVILAGTHYGKIRAMFNERNQRINEAGPATPVLILGLNGAPTAGDTFNVLPTEQEAREIASKREQLQRELGLRTKKRPGLEELGKLREDFHELNLVVKGDVDGSVEALSDSLIKLSTPQIQVNVLHKGVGAISESDVTLAAASDAIIIGFQVRPSGTARKEAEKEGVEIRLYSVIYKAIEEVKDAMEGLLSPEIREEITGTAEVLQTYHISKVGTIAGAIVRDGKIKRQSKVRVIRDGIVIYTGDLGSLKRFKDDVKDVVAGYDCGLSVQGYNDIRVGDMIEGFEEVEVKKTL